VAELKTAETGLTAGSRAEELNDIGNSFGTKLISEGIEKSR